MAAPLITSASNPRLKQVRRLRRRRGVDAFLVEGYRPLRCAVEAGAPLREVYAAPELFLGDGEAALVRRAALAARAWSSWAPTLSAPSPAARARTGWPRSWSAGRPASARCGSARRRSSRSPTAIERPGNLGTIVRTAARRRRRRAARLGRPHGSSSTPRSCRARWARSSSVPLAEAAPSARSRGCVAAACASSSRAPRARRRTGRPDYVRRRRRRRGQRAARRRRRLARRRRRGREHSHGRRGRQPQRRRRGRDRALRGGAASLRLIRRHPGVSSSSDASTTSASASASSSGG